MKFKFSLEKVLNHRNLQVDLAHRDFIQAQNIFFEAKKVLEDLIQEKEKNKKQRSEVVQTQNHWQAEVQQINLYLSGQDLRIARQNESLKKLEKEVESYREILRLAQTDAKMIDKLKDQKKVEFLKAFYETENKELDEIATLRYARIRK